MFKFLIFLFLFASAYGSVLPERPQLAMDWDRSGRIVGGEDADIKDAPYQVAVYYQSSNGNFYQTCGGSIISTRFIVTAAHCPAGAPDSAWRIRAGSTFSAEGGQLIDVLKIITHPDFNGFRLDYDISLFFLDFPIVLDGITTKPIPLPAQDAAVADGASAFITGWGTIREGGSITPILQKVTIPIVNQEDCINAYTGYNTVTPRMICAGLMETGGKDACNGDSGGPLVVDGVLIGITSWGRGCARAGFPGVWGRVPAFRNWIDNNVF